MKPDFDPSAPAHHEGIYGLPFTPEEAYVVIVPVPWEATVSYAAGTANGPAAILRASRQVDLLDRETGRPYEAGIAMLPLPAEVREWSDQARDLAVPVIENGGPGERPGPAADGRALVNTLGDRLNGWVYEETRRWLEAGKLVGVLGGDHSAPFGAVARGRRAPPRPRRPPLRRPRRPPRGLRGVPLVARVDHVQRD